MRTYMYLKRLAMAGVIASALALTLTAGVAQADCVGIYCSGPTGPQIQQQQAAASTALTLAGSISNPVAKAAVQTAVAQSNALALQTNALLQQAANTKNPVVKAKLQQAALVAATAAKVLAELAASFAKATLKAEGKAAADAGNASAAQAHALKKPSPQAVQRQVKAWLAQAKGYAKTAKSLLNQAAKLLRGRPSNSAQQKAKRLIAQAKSDVNRARALNVKAKLLVARTK